MTLGNVKRLVVENCGIHHLFCYRGVRSQNEKFFGKIIKFYPSIFIVLLDNGVIRSFSYSDFLIGNLEILK